MTRGNDGAEGSDGAEGGGGGGGEGGGGMLPSLRCAVTMILPGVSGALFWLEAAQPASSAAMQVAPIVLTARMAIPSPNGSRCEKSPTGRERLLNAFYPVSGDHLAGKVAAGRGCANYFAVFRISPSCETACGLPGRSP